MFASDGEGGGETDEMAPVSLFFLLGLVGGASDGLRRGDFRRLHLMAAKVALRRGCPLLFALKLLLQFVLSTASTSLPRDAVFVAFQPEFVHDLVEGEERRVDISVRVKEEALLADDDNNPQWMLDAKSLMPEIATVAASDSQYNKSSFVFNNFSRFYSLDSSISVRGVFLGKAAVQVRLVRADDWLESDVIGEGLEEEHGQGKKKGSHAPSPLLAYHKLHSNTLDVWVTRGNDNEYITKAFVGTLMLLIGIANVLMGCELDTSVVLETLKRPVAPLIGMFTQFVVMPLLAYSISQSLFVPLGQYSFALGLFVTGCAPGGGASNFWTILLGGNVNLSVTMTFLSTLASLVMMPLWMKLLGGDFLVGFSSSASPARVRVPYARIASSLATLVIPLLVGVAIAKYRPSMAAKARKIMRPFIICTLAFVVIFGALTHIYWFRMITWRALFGGLLLPWCGFMFGCFSAIITRRVPADVTAIAIETGIQNTGIAILLLKFSFPAPDCDISSLLPMVVACFTPGPLLLGAAVHTATKALRNKRGSSVDVEKPSSPSCTSPSAVVLRLPLADSPESTLIGRGGKEEETSAAPSLRLALPSSSADQKSLHSDSTGTAETSA